MPAIGLAARTTREAMGVEEAVLSGWPLVT